jgi:uncharacterized membrane protein YccF (DUF307 family)
MIVLERKAEPGWLIQFLWFLAIGWWATALWVSIAWILLLPILTIPIALAMLNRVPYVVALRQPSGRNQLRFITANGTLVSLNGGQRPFLLRAVYFLVIGWWWSAVVIVLAYALALTILGLPIAFWLFDQVPGAVTLQR